MEAVGAKGAGAAGVEIVDLGRIGYDAALSLQMQRVEAVAAGERGAALFLLEHAPVITLGRSGSTANLLVSPELLEQRGVALVHAKRGGDVTCHFPGQLVAYPIMRLAGRPGGLRGVFHDLEEVVIRLLSGFSITAGRQEGRPGVWLGQRKIASVGLGVRRWVTFHGLALNVLEDVGLFSAITPCGLADAVPTSMELERRAAGMRDWRVEMQEVKDGFVREFREVFQVT